MRALLTSRPRRANRVDRVENKVLRHAKGASDVRSGRIVDIEREEDDQNSHCLSRWIGDGSLAPARDGGGRRESVTLAPTVPALAFRFRALGHATLCTP